MNPGESCLPGNFSFEVGYLEIIDKFKESILCVSTFQK